MFGRSEAVKSGEASREGCDYLRWWVVEVHLSTAYAASVPSTTSIVTAMAVHIGSTIGFCRVRGANARRTRVTPDDPETRPHYRPVPTQVPIDQVLFPCLLKA